MLLNRGEGRENTGQFQLSPPVISADSSDVPVHRYFFKRLRFLGNKTFSHFATLMFLAVWHGYYPGYFGSFMLEFFVMRAEREVRALYVTCDVSVKIT